VMRDYANYFYPYIRDQLDLPMREFGRLYRSFSKMGLGSYPMFHVNCALGYVLGSANFESLARVIRRKLGRTLHLGRLQRPS
jgi:abequosyltransferase